MVWTISLLNHCQTKFLIKIKTQAILKFLAAFTAFLAENVNQQKSILLQQPQVLSHVIKRRWSQLFHIFAPAICTNILTSIQD